MSRDRRTLVATVFAGIVALGSASLYVVIDRSDLPPPFAHVEPEPSSGGGQGAASTPAASLAETQSQRRAPLGSGAPLGGMRELTERLAAQLRQHPNDLEGWRMLGWSYLTSDRFSDAVLAYRKAIELDPDTPSLRSLLGEALVKAANGRLTGEAKAAFEQALALDRADPGARYYMAREGAGPR